MTGIQGSFDASQFKPDQGGARHPIGNKFPFVIVGTEIKPNKDQTGGYLQVEFETPAGRIKNIYNLFSQSPKAAEIAHGQLSALCHATGIFRLDFQNEAAALRNGRGMLDVGLQDADKPDGYVEVKRVYDANGNEPGKNPAPAPQPQGFSAPMTQQPNGAWPTQPQGGAPQGQPAQQQAWQQPPQPSAPPPNAAPAGWPTQAPPAQQQPPQGQPQPDWQQQPSAQGGAPNTPPWGAPRS